ncbi:hypothetical protein PSEUDT2_00735 [Stutzerimonas stutzeri]|nr:hypothetical protein PSEUDT2_00735 [Stutzerimonas stutzeri]
MCRNRPIPAQPSAADATRRRTAAPARQAAASLLTGSLGHEGRAR